MAPHLFVFTNRLRNVMKVVYFDESGFAMWAKKLERAKFPWPRHLSRDVIEVNAEDMALLMQGLDVWRKFEKLYFERVV